MAHELDLAHKPLAYLSWALNYRPESRWRLCHPHNHYYLTSKLSMQCTNNIVMLYTKWFWRMLHLYYNIIVIELYYKSIHHKKAKIIKCTYISIIIIQLKYWEIFLLKKKKKKKTNFEGILQNKSWYRMCLSLSP